MDEYQVMSSKRKIFRKTIRTDVESRLQSTLGDLEQTIGKKEFQRRIKKAGKVLTSKLKVPKVSPDQVLKLPAVTPAKKKAQ